MPSVYFFYFFASLMILCIFLAITATNPVHCVLFFVSAFISFFGLLLLLNVDFLSLLYLIIYVGAVIIVFLCVVMMLKVKITERSITTNVCSFINIIIGCFIFYYILMNANFFIVPLDSDTSTMPVYVNWFAKLCTVDNIKMIGYVLFNVYSIYFILAGLVLLIGIISVILLSRESNKVNRRYQLVYQQISRDVTNAVFLVE